MSYSPKFWAILLLCTVLSGLASLSSPSQVRASLDDWPAFHHDPGRTGASSGSAPHTNHVTKQFSLPSPVAYYNSLGFYAEPGVEADGLLYFVGYSGASITGIYAIDADNGHLIWNYSYPALPASSTSSSTSYGASLDVDGGRLFHAWWIFTSSNKGVSYQGYVYAFNASNGQLLWTYGKGEEISDLVVSNGRVYIGGPGFVSALNATCGCSIWSEQPYSGYGLTVADGLLSVGPSACNPYVPSTFYALNASIGTLVWDYSSILRNHGFPHGVYCAGYQLPAGGGQIFLEYEQTDQGLEVPGIVAVNTTSGLPMWSAPTGGGLQAGVLHGSLFFDSDASHIYAYNRTNGAVIWRQNIQGRVSAYADGLLFVTDGYALDALNATMGATVWSYVGLDLRGYGDIIISGGKLYAVGGHSVVVFENGTGPTDFNVIIGLARYAIYGRGYLDCSQPIAIPIGINSMNGFKGNVSLSVSGLPSQAAATWSNNPVTIPINQGIPVTLSIQNTNSLCNSGKVYSLNFTASNGTLSHNYLLQFAFNINVPAFPPWALTLFLLLAAVVRLHRTISKHSSSDKASPQNSRGLYLMIYLGIAAHSQ